MTVSPRFERRTAISQSEPAEGTHHSFIRHFYPTVRFLSFLWTLAHRTRAATLLSIGGTFSLLATGYCYLANFCLSGSFNFLKKWLGVLIYSCDILLIHFKQQQKQFIVLYDGERFLVYSSPRSMKHTSMGNSTGWFMKMTFFSYRFQYCVNIHRPQNCRWKMIFF